MARTHVDILALFSPHYRVSPLSSQNKVYFQRSRSNAHRVYLTSLSQASTGRYRCEVSEEGPMFATDSEYGDLLVVVVPQNGPTLSGELKNR